MQHLIINGSSDKESLGTIVSACPNVRTLSIHLPSSIEGDDSELIMNHLLPVPQEIPRLSHLIVAFWSISFDEFLTQPVLNITHLDVVLVLTPYFFREQWEVLTDTHQLGLCQLNRPLLKLLLRSSYFVPS